jgi:hypothetical protein
MNKWKDVIDLCTNAVGIGRQQEVSSKEMFSVTLDDVLKFTKGIFKSRGERTHAGSLHKHVSLPKRVNLLFCIHTELRSVDHPIQETDTLE